MCGFCGFTGQVVDREQYLQEMAEQITHRGPDSQGTYLDDDIAMAFRRLSIIDLEGGDQPLYNEDHSLVLMFNGEIYNYRQLGEELRDAGHVFATGSDGEVLVHGFEEWGEGLLPRLRGMFAFAIWNTAERSLFIARDYFGIKPMHYTQLPGGRIVFASEIKSILPHPDVVREFNEKALDDYLSYQYVVPPATFFKGIYCLPPAHYLRFQEGQAAVCRYWEPVFRPEEDMPLDEAVEQIDRAFTDSVEAHRISDVEVGCFLSGGVDSSFVASYFGGQKAFTVGFDNGRHYNESTYAAELAKELGIEHYTHLITEEEYWESLPRVQYHLDQPLADPSCGAVFRIQTGGGTCESGPLRRRGGRVVRWLSDISRAHLPGGLPETAPLFSPGGGCPGLRDSLRFQGKILPYPGLQVSGRAVYRQCLYVRQEGERPAAAHCARH